MNPANDLYPDRVQDEGSGKHLECVQLEYNTVDANATVVGTYNTIWSAASRGCVAAAVATMCSPSGTSSVLNIVFYKCLLG